MDQSIAFIAMDSDGEKTACIPRRPVVMRPATATATAELRLELRRRPLLDPPLRSSRAAAAELRPERRQERHRRCMGTQLERRWGWGWGGGDGWEWEGGFGEKGRKMREKEV
uniref:Uncharacterized protein n=1 Tax=Oryza sativa subsp. japonica TaxID=39947 RepID=Q653Y5_ORYSJ|nr:hypothetical protein [Oryza sativa Japonica Group]BAD45882.1 hypothetical protein [Oryza sativa Japonica Group]